MSERDKSPSPYPMLSMLAAKSVLEVEREDDGRFRFTEACDHYHGARLTWVQMHALADELKALASDRMTVAPGRAGSAAAKAERLDQDEVDREMVRRMVDDALGSILRGLSTLHREVRGFEADMVPSKIVLDRLDVVGEQAVRLMDRFGIHQGAEGYPQLRNASELKPGQRWLVRCPGIAQHDAALFECASREDAAWLVAHWPKVRTTPGNCFVVGVPRDGEKVLPAPSREQVDAWNAEQRGEELERKGRRRVTREEYAEIVEKWKAAGCEAVQEPGRAVGELKSAPDNERLANPVEGQIWKDPKTGEDQVFTEYGWRDVAW